VGFRGAVWQTQGADATSCVTHVGPGGSGHYVKMVHNGIEYADMQFIAEAYDLMRAVGGLSHEAVAAHFRTWNDGRLQSYLFEITADILVKVRAVQSGPFEPLAPFACEEPLARDGSFPKLT